MLTKLLMRVVVVAVDCRLFEGAVHALDLPIGPRMVRLGELMLDTMLGTDAIKQQWEGVAVALSVDKLDAIVGQDRVDFVGHSGDEVAQELDSDRSGHPFVQFSEGELRGAINGDKQVQFAFFGLHFGDVEMKIANRVHLETFFLRWLIADVWQPTDAMT